MPEESIVVLTTFPDAETARRVAATLVEERLAACVNLVPQIESIYRWEGKIESNSEVLAIIKTNSWKYQPLESRIRQLHPYKVPEIISLRIDSGNIDYLRWIDNSVL